VEDRWHKRGSAWRKGEELADLLGTHGYALDPKGRVSLPQRFRDAFADGVWITAGQERCLYCFPRAEWDRRSEEIGSSSLSDARGRAFARLFFGQSDEARLDAQGRITIPQRLRDLAGITKDVVVLGVRERMEIWDRDEYERYVAEHRPAYEKGTLSAGVSA
jgi:MraZ protein